MARSTKKPGPREDGEAASMRSKEELFRVIKSLTDKEFRYTDAIALLAKALDDEHRSDQERSEISGKREELQNKQAKLFGDAVKKLDRYFQEPMKPVSKKEIADNVDRALEKLGSIDSDRMRRLQELEERAERLRHISELEWIYSDITNKVQQRLDEALKKREPHEQVAEAKETLAYLTNEVLPQWRGQESTNDLARSLMPRLLSLAEKTEKKVGELAQRVNILTTQAGNVNFWQLEEEYQRWVKTSHFDTLDIRPDQMPQMIWKEQDGIRKYVPEGVILNLSSWYDAFLGDALIYASRR